MSRRKCREELPLVGWRQFRDDLRQDVRVSPCWLITQNGIRRLPVRLLVAFCSNCCRGYVGLTQGSGDCRNRRAVYRDRAKARVNDATSTKKAPRLPCSRQQPFKEAFVR